MNLLLLQNILYYAESAEFIKVLKLLQYLYLDNGIDFFYRYEGEILCRVMLI